MDELRRDAAVRIRGRLTTVASGGEVVVNPGVSIYVQDSDPSWILHKTRMETEIETSFRNSVVSGTNLDHEDLKDPEYFIEADSIFHLGGPTKSHISTTRSRLMNLKPSDTMWSTPSTRKSETSVSSSSDIDSEEDDVGPFYRMESVLAMDVPADSTEKLQFAEKGARESIARKSRASGQIRGQPQDEVQIQIQRPIQPPAQNVEVFDSDLEDELVDESMKTESSTQLSISLQSLLHGSTFTLATKSSKALSEKTVVLDEYMQELFQVGSSEPSDMTTKSFIKEDMTTKSFIKEDMTTKSFIKEVTLNADICNELGVLPELDEISERFSDDFVAPAPVAQAVSFDTDIGKFVQPLTGSSLESITSTLLDKPSKKSLADRRRTGSKKSLADKRRPVADVSEEELLYAIEEGEQEEREEEVDIEDTELLALIEMDDGLEELDRQELLQQQPPENTIEHFLEVDHEKKVALDDGTNFEMIAAEQAKLKVIEHTEEFLDELIRIVVEICETVDPLKEMSTQLDKMKLIDEIESMVSQLEVEQRARFFLNRKTVDYFRRKKIFRTILEDSPEHIGHHIERYSEVVAKLNQLMGQEEDMKALTETKIQHLKSVYSTEAMSTELKVTEFNELVQQTIVRESSKDQDKMLAIVKKLLSIMQNVRSEISRVRFLLIQKQHNHSTLIEKLEKVENIGNGLRLRDYESLQTEALALGKKIEERNSELSKFRARCNVELHMIAHLRERQQMFRSSIATQKEAFEELKREKSACRRRMFVAKTERAKVRRELKELSYQGGLMDKPALMRDYDETVQTIENRRKVVRKLKTKYLNLVQRIAEAEKWLHDANTNNDTKHMTLQKWQS